MTKRLTKEEWLALERNLKEKRHRRIEKENKEDALAYRAWCKLTGNEKDLTREEWLILEKRKELNK